MDIKKITTHGKLLETVNSTEAQKQYLHYFYNNKFYRIIKQMGEVAQIIKIKKDYLSELAIYNLTK